MLPPGIASSRFAPVLNFSRAFFSGKGTFSNDRFHTEA